MELRKGYKHTEIGIIPEDWCTVKLCEGINLLSGHHILAQYCNTEGKGVPYLTGPADFQRGYIQNSKFTLHPSTVCKTNDILLTVKGSGAGTMVLADAEYCISRQLMAIRSASWNISYIYSVLKKDESLFGAAATGLIPGLSRTDILKKIIPLPPTTQEQTAIANALSDIDDLITNLEILISKKRNIKQGAMQKLLQPKEDWVKKILPEVCWFQEGPGVRNSQFTTSGVKLLNGTNIEDGKLLLEKTSRYISNKEAFGWYSHFLVDDGDILIACSGVTIDKFHEKVTIASKDHLPLCMNTSTMRFKIISKTLSKKFFLHYLKSKLFKEEIGGKATGSAQLNFGPAHVKVVEISLPPLEEQIRIATILSDMDTEIIALATKLEKYRNLKLGMMQNLLTGKIRLI